MAKKSARKIAAKDADQYMVRLPPGLRDRLARRAAENGRSMNTEIVDAIEKHLEGADRITKLWEEMPDIWDAIQNLESEVERMTGAPLSRVRAAKKFALKDIKKGGS